MASKELLDQPNTRSAVNSLNIELQTGDSAIGRPLFLDQLEPLVVDVAGIDVCRRKTGAPSEIVVARQPGFAENAVYCAAAPATKRGERVADQRLGAVRASLDLERRRFTDGGLGRSHGPWWWSWSWSFAGWPSVL